MPERSRAKLANARSISGKLSNSMRSPSPLSSPASCCAARAVSASDRSSLSWRIKLVPCLWRSRRDVGPAAAAFLRRAIWLYFGDALQNKVPISLLGPVCHALCSGSQAGRDVAAFVEHRGDLCFFHEPRPGVDQRILQGFVRGARDVGVTQPCGGDSQPTP